MNLMMVEEGQMDDQYQIKPSIGAHKHGKKVDVIIFINPNLTIQSLNRLGKIS